MSLTSLFRRPLPRVRTTSKFPIKLALFLALPLGAMLTFISVSKGQTPLPPEVELAAKPLYSAGTRDKPTLTLALSVEFPTVGAQYTGTAKTLDDSYSPAKEYLGYFDYESCYEYVNHADPALRRFDRIGPAKDRECDGKGFSGNFMNWASSSAVDLLRLGLTGGDRIVDTPEMTVLQRAVLPTRPERNWFFNNENFPAKMLKPAHLKGAVPTALLGSHPTDKPIWIANCLNRVHFGTERQGTCTDPLNNANLGTPAAANAIGPVSDRNMALSNDFTACSKVGEKCTFDGVREVAFGFGTTWKVAPVKNSVECVARAFNSALADDKKLQCFIRADSSNWTPPGDPPKVLSSDRFFYTRVKVCESNGSNVLLDPRHLDLADKERALCARQPSGNYKPVGQLQRNSDAVRVAAFGYLLDDDKKRYGGVQRAPMKYVGGNRYDSKGVLISGPNPNREWDEQTGVFIRNPEGAKEEISGVINYLNQFGRTGIPGTYKHRDPVAELYYESLRYVQGLPPTPEATKNMDEAMKDGFPVYKEWIDPHANGSSKQDYSCIRNNILAIGDVRTHHDRSIPGNKRGAGQDFVRHADPSKNEPDFHFWTRVVGGFESDTPVVYKDGKGVSRGTKNPNPSHKVKKDLSGLEEKDVGQDSGSHFLAGMAYWANTHDIRGADWADEDKRRPGMRVTTYVVDVNTHGEQHDPEKRRRNQFYLGGKYGGFKDRSGFGNPFLNERNELDNSSWERPNEEGEALNYFLSSDARTALASIRAVFEEIAKKGNSIAGAAVSTQRLAVSGNTIFQGQFDPAAWNGDLVALQVSHNSNVVTIAEKPKWSAAAELDAMEPSNRRIFVGKNLRDAVPAATRFEWDHIEASLKDALDRPGPSFPVDKRGQDRLNYLRGDQTYEKTAPAMRRRASRLGAIINSGVAFSGPPTPSIQEPGYKAFYNANVDRTPTVFVGANDGMLHAFSAKDGKELFAYIPSWLGPKLPLLTTEDYLAQPQAYVDATAVASEALLGSTWKTVLVGGTGAGGQGVFALDVTDPDGFTESSVLWEFTDKDDADLGNVVGRPQIRKFRISDSKDPTPKYKWFAVVPGGVNNHSADGSASTTGKPAIFLLDLAKPQGTAWTLGSNYHKIVLPLDPALATKRAAGVVNLSVTSGDAGEVKHMYFGDLHGRMWKLDFANAAAAAASTWIMDKLSMFVYKDSARPMFVARDSDGVPQPITMAPNLPVGPRRSTLVVFGTGKYLEPSDNLVLPGMQRQSVYALFDDGRSIKDTDLYGTGAISGRSALQAGSVIASGDVSMPSFSWGHKDGERAGWYVDLSRLGERQISSGTMFGTDVVFGSVVPPSSLVEPCGTGSGNLYRVRVLDGSGKFRASPVGLLGQPVVLELGAGTTYPSDSTGRRKREVTAQIILQGSSGMTAPSKSELGQLEHETPVGRLSWRQIHDYDNLKKEWGK